MYNALGHGFPESVYAHALWCELTHRGLHVKREVPIEVRYKGEVVGAFRADMVVASRVVVENKATRSLVDLDRRQLLNDLRATELELGLLLGFGQRAAFHRVIATNTGSTIRGDPRHPRDRGPP